MRSTSARSRDLSRQLVGWRSRSHFWCRILPPHNRRQSFRCSTNQLSSRRGWRGSRNARQPEGTPPKDGFYAEFGHMITGSGWIAAGPGYRHQLFARRAIADVSGAISWRTYKAVQARLEFPNLANDRLLRRVQSAVARLHAGPLLRRRARHRRVRHQRLSAAIDECRRLRLVAACTRWFRSGRR